MILVKNGAAEGTQLEVQRLDHPIPPYSGPTSPLVSVLIAMLGALGLAGRSAAVWVADDVM